MSDIAYAVKELSTKMISPNKGDWETIKKLGRYLIGRTRVVSKYQYQEGYCRLETRTDSDHAGGWETRKSTSGGVVKMGKHTGKTWSSTQGVIALSSGEAEFYGSVKAAGAGLGQQSLLRDIGLDMLVCAWTDSSAALGTITRSGLGRLRHSQDHSL